MEPESRKMAAALVRIRIIFFILAMSFSDLVVEPH
jgi:hypothetical protein